MNRPYLPSLLLRILLPLIFITVLGITARPHPIAEALMQASQAMASGDFIAAASLISAAASFAPWRGDLWELAGRQALQGANPKAAERYLRRAATIGSLTPEGYIAFGDAAFANDETDTAIRAWKRALQSGGPADLIYPRLIDTYLQIGDRPAAIEHQRSLTHFKPADPQLNYRLGLLLAAYQPESSLAYLARAAELDPTLGEATQTISRSVRFARASGDPAYLLLASGRALASLGEWELAAEAFSQAVEIRPEYAEAWAFLGEARGHLGEDGLVELEKAVALDPQSVAANAFLALHWKRRDQLDLAYNYLKVAARIDPQNPALQVEIGDTLALQGNLADAQVHYQHATQLAPREASYWRQLASFCNKYQSQLREVGLPAARQAVILNPQDPVSLDVMAQTLTLLDEPLIAQRFLQRALRADPAYAPAHLHLGVLYLLQGDTAHAREHLTLAQSLASSETPAAEQANHLLQTYFP